MAKQPEHEEKNAAPDSKKPSDSEASDDSAPPSKVALVRLKLKLIANYAMRGFVPVLSMLALIFAVIAFVSNKSSQMQFNNAAAKIDSINASLSATKGELEKLKITIAQRKAAQENESRKQDEKLKQHDEKLKQQDAQATKIIQSVTKLQVKMKITPTLADQLNPPASAVAAVSTVKEKKLTPQVQAIKDAIDKFNK
jgi:hypothetical protein